MFTETWLHRGVLDEAGEGAQRLFTSFNVGHFFQRIVSLPFAFLWTQDFILCVWNWGAAAFCCATLCYIMMTHYQMENKCCWKKNSFSPLHYNIIFKTSCIAQLIRTYLKCVV